MEKNYKHFEFYDIIVDKANYNGYGKDSVTTTFNKGENRITHSKNLNSNIEHLEKYYNAYFKQKKSTKEQNGENDINFPLLLQIDTNSKLFDELHKYGIDVLCEEENGFLITAIDSNGLKLFKKKIEEFSTKVRGSALIANIHKIANENIPEIKLSSYLYTLWPFEDNTNYTVEVNIDCKGLEPFVFSEKNGYNIEENKTKYEQAKLNYFAKVDEILTNKVDSFKMFLNDYDSSEYEILDESCPYYDENSLPEYYTVKLSLNGKILRDITLNYSYVFEITEPDDFSCIQSNKNVVDLYNKVKIIPPNEKSPVVGIIDSGIQEGHKYIAPAILKNVTKSYVDTETPYDEIEEAGHGTRVARRVLYPTEIPKEGEYTLPCWIANYKILDKECKIPINKMPQALYNEILTTSPFKLFNSSVNSVVPCQLKRMSAWASEIDNCIHAKDILVVQSVGNIQRVYDKDRYNILGIKEYLQQGIKYPDFLLEKGSRLANPAQSFFALTVGSINKEEFLDQNSGLKSIEQQDTVSSFSRTGFGLWDSIKPEVVEYGGGFVSNNDYSVIKQNETTSIELIRKSPEGPAYAKDGIGTSFAAPAITSLIVKIQEQIPNCTPLLAKVLLVHSASWPKTIDIAKLSNDEIVNNFKYMGYGIPNINEALQNNPYKITFITEGTVEIKSGNAHIHYIPIPDKLRDPSLENKIKVTVTLCYTSKPRRTRRKKNGYLANWVDWISIKKDETVSDFKNRIFSSEKSENDNYRWFLGYAPQNNGILKNISRSNSATQKDWALFRAHELPEKFAIAVRSHKGWSRDPFEISKYALAVSIESTDSDLEIYSQIEAIVKAETTVEVET